MQNGKSAFLSVTGASHEHSSSHEDPSAMSHTHGSHTESRPSLYRQKRQEKRRRRQQQQEHNRVLLNHALLELNKTLRELRDISFVPDDVIIEAALAGGENVTEQTLGSSSSPRLPTGADGAVRIATRLLRRHPPRMTTLLRDRAELVSTTWGLVHCTQQLQNQLKRVAVRGNPELACTLGKVLGDLHGNKTAAMTSEHAKTNLAMVSTATLLLNSEKVINDVSNTLIRVEQTASIGCMPSPRGVLQRIGLEPPSMGLHSPRISARWAASAAAQRQRQLQMQRVHSPVASTMPSNNRELLDETNSGGVMNEADGIKSKVSTSSSQNCTTLPQLPQNAISSSNNIPGMIPMPLSMQMPNAPTMGAPISMPVMTAQGTQLSLPFHMPMPPSMTTASMSLPTPATEAPPLSLMDSIQDAPSTFEASKNNDDSTVLQAGLMSPPLGAPIEHDPYFMEDGEW